MKENLGNCTKRGSKNIIKNGDGFQNQELQNK